MDFINRAWKGIIRKPSKAILLISTFFLIGNLIIIGLGVYDASKSAKTLTRKKMRAVLTYQIDYDQIQQYINSIEDEDEQNKFYENFPRIKLEDVSELLKDERVRIANSVSTNMWYADENNSVDYVHLNNTREQNMEENLSQQCEIDENGNEVGDSIDLSPCDYLLDAEFSFENLTEEIEVPFYE